ncbi:Uncharacterised protein [BD1-7 clade bacterium]|uniref:Uncharacterized protein n=1 Tax=BD1-7 clade bacterium TaxID=2029982 RepID=A0A5S9N546_9GAMM|nr:Uncharacterised protein [BD1-7 clade bacterium]CAA0084626.1 Uncharacterised protein [BD1-7 clade bacterium]
MMNQDKSTHCIIDTISSGLDLDCTSDNNTFDQATLAVEKLMVELKEKKRKRIEVNYSSILTELTTPAIYEVTVSDKELSSYKKNSGNISVVLNVKLLNTIGLSLSTSVSISLYPNIHSLSSTKRIEIRANPTSLMTGNNLLPLDYSQCTNPKLSRLDLYRLPFQTPFIFVADLLQLQWSESELENIFSGKTTTSNFQCAFYTQLPSSALKEPYLLMLYKLYELGDYDYQHLYRVRDFLGLSKAHLARYTEVKHDNENKEILTSIMLCAIDTSNHKKFTLDLYDKHSWTKNRINNEDAQVEYMNSISWCADLIRLDCNLHLPALKRLLRKSGVNIEHGGKSIRTSSLVSAFEALDKLHPVKNTTAQYIGLVNWLDADAINYYTCFKTLHTYINSVLTPGVDNTLTIFLESEKGKNSKNKKRRKAIELLEKQWLDEPKRYAAKSIVQEKADLSDREWKALRKDIISAGLSTHIPFAALERIQQDTDTWGMNTNESALYGKLSGQVIELSTQQQTEILKEQTRRANSRRDKLKRQAFFRSEEILSFVGSVSKGNYLINPPPLTPSFKPAQKVKPVKKLKKRKSTLRNRPLKLKNKRRTGGT